MRQIALTVTVVFMAVGVGPVRGEGEYTGLVTVKGQDEELLLSQWEQIPVEVRKRIDSTIVGQRLGLSSTGRVQLIGVYAQQLPDDEDNPQRLLHLRQADLFGSRLFWSILVDPDKKTYRILFHVNENDGINLGDDDEAARMWRKLDDDRLEFDADE